MAKYYTINKPSRKLCGILCFGTNNSAVPAHNKNTILIPYDEKILGGLDFHQFCKSTFAIIVNDKIIGWEKDTSYDKDGEMKAKLLKEYTSEMVNSVVLGSMEGAMDLVVQMLDLWINNKTASELEIAQWNSFMNANREHFKLNIDGLTPKDIQSMVSLKQSARKIEHDMLNDERWPSEGK